MTEGDIRRLKLWIKREGWAKKWSRTHGFRFESSMPLNIMGPEVPPEAQNEASAKFVCVMCGYVTSVTDICRGCREMPATQEMIGPEACYTHGKGEGDQRTPRFHFKMRYGKRVWLAHEGIRMVCIASVQQRLDEETGDSRDSLVKSLALQEERLTKA